MTRRSLPDILDQDPYSFEDVNLVCKSSLDSLHFFTTTFVIHGIFWPKTTHTGKKKKDRKSVNVELMLNFSRNDLKMPKI